MCQFCCPNEHKCTENNHHPVDCPFRMISHPPNIMDYDEYIPSHREALDMLEKNGLLKGDREEYLKANLYYGKAKNYEERDKTEVKGITMAQAREAIKTAINESFQYLVSEGELSQEIVDNFIVPEVIASNATCELEKAMGIYPNIKIHKR
jgi:predicted adenine nucleotide alpha hydrolase (AANH) superfamily ATPase